MEESNLINRRDLLKRGLKAAAAALGLGFFSFEFNRRCQYLL